MFFRKKKSAELIEFNQEKLTKDMNNVGDRLHSYKEDDAMKDVRLIIKIGKDLSVLNCATAKSDNDRIFMQAKVEAYSDIQHFIDVCIQRKSQDSKEGKRPVSGTINAFRRAGNQAGSAI